jgi:hypothetical protein
MAAPRWALLFFSRGDLRRRSAQFKLIADFLNSSSLRFELLLKLGDFSSFNDSCWVIQINCSYLESLATICTAGLFSWDEHPIAL